MSKKKINPKTGRKEHDPAEIVKWLEDYKENAKPFPMFVTFCDRYKIRRSTLYLLKEKYEEVAEAMEFLKYRKRSIIIEDAVAGKINPQFAQFLLKYQCGEFEDEINNKDAENKPIINITIPKE